MIMEISSRQLVTVIGLGIAIVIELLCALLVFRRDPHFRGNQFTSAAYLSLSLALSFNTIYVFLIETSLIGILHRLADLFAIIGTIFIFLSAMFISEGSSSFKSHRMILPLIGIIAGLSLFLLPNNTSLIIYAGENQLPNTEQFIEWDLAFFGAAAIPIYLIVIGAFYYYYKVYRDIPKEIPMKSALLFILIGTIVLGVSHFLLVVPHILLDVFPVTSLVLIGNIGSIGVLFGSVIIFLGFRTRISEK